MFATRVRRTGGAVSGQAVADGVSGGFSYAINLACGWRSGLGYAPFGG